MSACYQPLRYGASKKSKNILKEDHDREWRGLQGKQFDRIAQIITFSVSE
jgi:hypothetical protein